MITVEGIRLALSKGTLEFHWTEMQVVLDEADKLAAAVDDHLAHSGHNPGLLMAAHDEYCRATRGGE